MHSHEGVMQSALHCCLATNEIRPACTVLSFGHDDANPFSVKLRPSRPANHLEDVQVTVISLEDWRFVS